MNAKRNLHTAVLCLLSLQIGARIACELDNDNIFNQLPDQTHNAYHPSTFMSSQENNYVLHYAQATKENDSNLFKEGMEKEVNSFKD